MKHVLGLSTIILLSGCVGYQYVASPPYVPVNTEKDVLTTNISYNSIQVGYAVTNSFSLFASGFYRASPGGIFKAKELPNENKGAYVKTDRHMDFEIGATFFKKVKGGASAELLSGVGYGKMNYSNLEDIFEDYEFKLWADKFKVYLQPVISLKMYDFCDVSLFSRFTYCSYFNINSSVKYGSRRDIHPTDKFFFDRNVCHLGIFEKGLQIRFGIKDLKFSMLVSQTSDPFNNYIQYKYVNIKFGVAWNIHMKNSKKEIL